MMATIPPPQLATVQDNLRRLAQDINQLSQADYAKIALDLKTLTADTSRFFEDNPQIAERIHLETEMRKLSLAVEQSPVSIVITDTQGTIEYVNPQFCALTGYSIEEARGQNPKILKSGLSPADQYKQLWKTITSGEIWRGEFCNKKKNGDLYWESAQISPVINEFGVITGFIAIKEDITIRKQVESALRASEERSRQLADIARINLEKLESVIDSMNELVMLFDPQGELVRINPAGLALYGFGTDVKTRIAELVQDTVEICYPDGKPVPPQESDLFRAMRGEHVVNVERVVRRKDTEKQWTGLFSARPILDSHGEPMIILVTGVDVTNLRNTQREYIAAQAWMDVQHQLIGQRELERLQIARDLHDGPVQELTAATFALRGILMEGCSPQLAQELEALQATLQDQINELRAYAGELRPPTLTKFGLAKAIQSHIDTFQDKHTRLQILFNCAQGGENLPEENALALFRVYQESMSNILKHAHATVVSIGLHEKDQKVILTIQDNGTGFELPQEWLTLARNGHLGLVGMRERVEAIGGEISITSFPGNGATIQVEVPNHKKEWGF
ncbi:MAG: PAS domain S-box protein [Anaerolineaceae bacterium]|nr:PAS domain S-box protein [Anaerolineaceae bacterium]